jgi:hypothetical protein
VHSLLFAVPPLQTFCYPVTSLYIYIAGNTKFPNCIVLQTDIRLKSVNSSNDLSTERHISVSHCRSINKPLRSNSAIFKFNGAICTAVTDITVNGQVQTEGGRKFTGNNGLGIYRSGTGVTDCVELDCIGLGANCVELDRIGLGANCVELDCIGLGSKLCGTGLYRFGGQIVWNWTV